MPACSPVDKTLKPKILEDPAAPLRRPPPTGVREGDVDVEIKGVSVAVCDGVEPGDSVGVIEGDGEAVSVGKDVFDGDAPSESVLVGV